MTGKICFALGIGIVLTSMAGLKPETKAEVAQASVSDWINSSEEIKATARDIEDIPYFGADYAPPGKVLVTGELKVWHTVTLTFEGPDAKENASPNPFLDYRLNVYFANGETCLIVPGYYAADGQAAETGAAAGKSWRVHFVPDKPGRWTYSASFRTGLNIAINPSPGAGRPGILDGLTAALEIGPGDKGGRDFRSKGRLQYVGERYLRFAGSGEYFLKAGADCPENFLGYNEFDGTYDTSGLDRPGEAAGGLFLHTYKPHEKDWRPGDPVWKGNKGKGIIGALNYLASKGMNSVYFITYNLDGGDGKDVWPWTAPDERLRFDCSKLDQWDIVFSHMDAQGVVMHLLTQETENDHGLDGGDLGIQRRLYYRELIARFGHHRGLVWNLGEENTNTDAQRKAFAGFFKETDAYRHPVVVHTFPGQYDAIYNPLLGYEDFDGPSLQMNETGSDTHAETLKWVGRSKAFGRSWFVCLDEYGHGRNGVKPDSLDPGHDEPRQNALWGNLMAGGAGCEWYFGYEFPHNDLNCEDWRSRDLMWDQTRWAVEFFHKYLPFPQMNPEDTLVTAGWCLAQKGKIYCVYLPEGGPARLNLDEGNFTVRWFNPRTGGELSSGSIKRAVGPGWAGLGQPPSDPKRDWVVLVKRTADKS